MVTAADLAAYRVVDREPLRVAYRDREVLINPPPSAGGILIARALSLLDAMTDPRARRRSPQVVAGDGEHPARAHAGVPRRPRRSGVRPRRSSAGAGWAAGVDHARRRAGPRRLGVLGDLVGRLGVWGHRARDRCTPQQHDGRAGPQPPGLSPPPAGPADAEHDVADGRAARRHRRSWRSAARGQTGSARRCCRRSSARSTRVCRPRRRSTRRGCTTRTAIVYAEPGIDTAALVRAGYELAPFRDRNLFFGGAQAVARGADGRFSGGGDPAPRGCRDRRRGAVTGRRARRAADGRALAIVVAVRGRRLRPGRPGGRPVRADAHRSGDHAEAAGQQQRHDPVQRRQGQADLQRAADPGPRPVGRSGHGRQEEADHPRRRPAPSSTTGSRWSRARSRSPIAAPRRRSRCARPSSSRWPPRPVRAV